MGEFDEARLGVAASVGISEGARDAAVRCAGKRKQSGRQVGACQGTKCTLADMAIGLRASRSPVSGSDGLALIWARTRRRLQTAAGTVPEPPPIRIELATVRVFESDLHLLRDRRKHPAATSGSVGVGTNGVMR
jgi:alkylation response protein AidB-like acyl-CoA dehydrogenase